jgi:hypothetical protein
MIDDLDGFGKPSFQIDIADNVGTALCAVEPGELILVQGGADAQRLEALESILLGHKVAIAEIPKGAFVIKYGAPIGITTDSVRPGEWVHLHNCRSQVDERSPLPDQLSDATQDTAYA